MHKCRKHRTSIYPTYTAAPNVNTGLKCNLSRSTTLIPVLTANMSDFPALAKWTSLLRQGRSLRRSFDPPEVKARQIWHFGSNFEDLDFENDVNLVTVYSCLVCTLQCPTDLRIHDIPADTFLKVGINVIFCFLNQSMFCLLI